MNSFLCDLALIFGGMGVMCIVLLAACLKFLLSDPDGAGGWRSRLQQLGAEHEKAEVK